MLMNPTSYSTLQACLGGKSPGPVDSLALAKLMSMGFDKSKANKALQGSNDTAQALERLIQGLQEATSEGSSEQSLSTAAADVEDAADSPESIDLDPWIRVPGATTQCLANFSTY